MNILIKKFIMVIAIMLSSLSGLSQTSDRTVTLVVSGDGETKDEAIKQALRSAIEQTFGTFISANTEVLNDEIIQDEIVTVSSGNIIGYKEVNTITNSDGTYSSTVEATVSIGKLTNFAKSKGMSVDLETGAFAMNMKIRELNKENEIHAINDLQNKLLKMHSEYNFFDYNLSLSEPYLKGDNYAIKATIDITPNQNLANYRNAIISTLESLSLSETELEEYKRANIPVKVFNIRKYNSDNEFLKTIQIPYPEQHKNDKQYTQIILRNNDDHYPSLYFPTLLLKNQLQFALQDNLENAIYTVYTSGDLDLGRKVIAHSSSPLWPVYEFDESYRNKGSEAYSFMSFGDMSNEILLPSLSCYKMDEDTLDFILWNYQEKGFSDKSAKYFIELEYPKEIFTNLNKIDLKFFNPYYIERK